MCLWFGDKMSSRIEYPLDFESGVKLQTELIIKDKEIIINDLNAPDDRNPVLKLGFPKNVTSIKLVLEIETREFE